MAAATKQRVVNKTERRLNRRNTCATVCISSFLPDNCEIDLWCDKVDLMDDVHKYQYLLKWKKWIVVQLSAIFYPLTATLHTASLLTYPLFFIIDSLFIIIAPSYIIRFHSSLVAGKFERQERKWCRIKFPNEIVYPWFFTLTCNPVCFIEVLAKSWNGHRGFSNVLSRRVALLSETGHGLFLRSPFCVSFHSRLWRAFQFFAPVVAAAVVLKEAFSLGNARLSLRLAPPQDLMVTLLHRWWWKRRRRERYPKWSRNGICRWRRSWKSKNSGRIIS